RRFGHVDIGIAANARQCAHGALDAARACRRRIVGDGGRGLAVEGQAEIPAAGVVDSDALNGVVGGDAVDGFGERRQRLLVTDSAIDKVVRLRLRSTDAYTDCVAAGVDVDAGRLHGGAGEAVAGVNLSHGKLA